MARMRLGSSSETRVISSRNPGWFFRIGRTFSFTVRVRSLAFPVLLVTSTTRVNIQVLLSLRVESCTVSTAVGYRELPTTILLRSPQFNVENFRSITLGRDFQRKHLLQ